MARPTNEKRLAALCETIKTKPGTVLESASYEFIRTLSEADLENFKAALRRAKGPVKKLADRLDADARKDAEAATAKDADKVKRALLDELKDKPAGQGIERLKAVGLQSRALLFAPAAMGFMAKCWNESPELIEDALDYWRDNGVANVKGIEDTIKRTAREQAKERKQAIAVEAGEHVIELHKSRADLTHKRIEAALVATMPGKVFNQHGRMVRLDLVQPKTTAHDGAIIDPGFCRLKAVNEAWLGPKMQENGVRFNSYAGGELQDVPPPWTILSRFIECGDYEALQQIRGVCGVPTLHRDQPGYDPISKFFCAFPHGTFPPIPKHPTRADAEAAFARIVRPLRSYSFLDGPSRAVAISTFHSAVLRPSMRSCPAHHVTGQAESLGKTKIPICAALLQNFSKPKMMAFGSNEDEVEKRIATALLNGASMLCFDNVEVRIHGAALCLILTTDHFTTRILGAMTEATLDTCCLFVFTGKRIKVDGDMRRRSVICTITTGGRTRVRDRQHTFDPVEEVAANRGQMVADIITVTRAWLQAGRPLPPRFKTMASFEDYDLIRGPLLWLGESDPMETQNELYETDEEAEDRAALVLTLYERFGDRSFLSRDISEILQNENDADCNFKTAICGIGSNARDVGQSLREASDMPAGDFILQQVGKRDNAVIWKIFLNEKCTEDDN